MVAAVVVAAGCSGKSKSSGTDGGSGGLPPMPCTAAGSACEPNGRCVPSILELQSTFAAGPAPSAVELGDVNGDGHLDAVIVQEATSGVVTLLGTGDGSFGEPLTSPIMRNARDLALGDFNEDERLDVAIPGAPSVVLLGDGEGTFGEEVSVHVSGQSVSVGDVNDDGHLDLVLASSPGFAASLLRGNGDASFVTSTISLGIETPRDTLLAHLNDDDALDVAAVHIDSASISTVLGDGNARFTEPQSFRTTGADTWALLLADFDGDGQLDAATANDGSADASLLFGNNDGSFSGATRYPTGTATGSLAAADFDDDGELDLAVGHANASLDAAVVSVLLGTGGGLLAPDRVVHTGQSAVFMPSANFTGLATGDLDGDGTVELVALSCIARELAVLRRTPYGRCEPSG